MYESIEKEIKEIQQAMHLVCIVPTAPSLSQAVELGDEPS
jgi:hypothetical protein